MNEIKLTLADKKILSLLEYDPRITLKELAEYCNLSKDTIKYRINRLEEKKIILNYITFIDYKKLGNQSYKLYFKLKSSLNKRDEFKEYLRNQKNVFAIYESNGNWNLAIAIFAKNHFQFKNIENSILEKFGDIIFNRRFDGGSLRHIRSGYQAGQLFFGLIEIGDVDFCQRCVYFGFNKVNGCWWVVI